MLVPPYFRKMEEYNLNGAPLLSELAFPSALSLADFEEEMQEPNMAVVDTRMPYAFAASHIPGSFSIWLGGTSIYPGWLFSVSQYFLFVHERAGDMKRVTRRFRRIGFDNMCGFLCHGMSEWQDEGKPLSSVGALSASALKAKMDRNEVWLLDVREPSEWKQEGYVEAAERVFVGNLQEKADSLRRDKAVAVTCSVGNRGSIAASILRRKGFSEVYNVLGGMAAWKRLGYPVKKG
jgi:hydroxyacylglutathione hydrolase